MAWPVGYPLAEYQAGVFQLPRLMTRSVHVFFAVRPCPCSSDDPHFVQASAQF